MSVQGVARTWRLANRHYTDAATGITRYIGQIFSFCSPMLDCVYPPAFRITQRLLDWPRCWVEFTCPCGMKVMHPTRLLAAKHGNRTFENIFERAKCSLCKSKPMEVWLCAGHHRERGLSSTPDWAIQIVL